MLQKTFVEICKTINFKQYTTIKTANLENGDKLLSIKNLIITSGRLYRGKKRVMFQISKGTSLFDAVWSPEHFDTLFYWYRSKNETVMSKTKSDEGGLWGSWKWQFGPNILF